MTSGSNVLTGTISQQFLDAKLRLGTTKKKCGLLTRRNSKRSLLQLQLGVLREVEKDR